MIKTKKDFILKVHLICSVCIVVPTAFVYGFRFDSLLNFDLNTVDEFSQFKAIMGLYLGFSVLWILGILKETYLRTAIISNMIFMLGLASGRLLSIFLDGTPSNVYFFGMIGEYVLGIYGMWLLKTKNRTF